MVDCPKCGEEMRVSGHIGPEPVYNCDKCGIDCYKPPRAKKETIKEPIKKDEAEEKQESKDKYIQEDTPIKKTRTRIKTTKKPKKEE